MINENLFLKNEKYLVAVSGGPDSMALLNMLIVENYKNIIVCHVNYHTRNESNYEQNMVEKFCLKHNISIYVLDTYHLRKNGNFEGWARNVRYNFFNEVAKKENIHYVFVAHHLDDMLETYVMQKKRRNIVKYYGLNEKTNIMDIVICRPLLNFTKSDLLFYCEKNNVPYSIDVTNNEDDIVRNRIRHSIIEKMDSLEKEEMVNKIKIENKKLEEDIKEMKDVKVDNNSFSIDDFHKLSNIRQKNMFLYSFLTSNDEQLINKISYCRINEIIKIIESGKPNLSLPLSGDKELVKEYSIIKILEINNCKQYSYVMEYPKELTTHEFSCDFTCDTTMLKITRESYPLTFRNVRNDDVVKIGNITKKVNRILIDEKISTEKRKKYPVVVNKDGKIVYIPLYKSDKQKNIANKLKFVIK